MWITTIPGGLFGSDIHIAPMNDAIAHEFSEDCACGPSGTPPRNGGHWIFRHHRLIEE